MGGASRGPGPQGGPSSSDQDMRMPPSMGGHPPPMAHDNYPPTSLESGR